MKNSEKLTILVDMDSIVVDLATDWYGAYNLDFGDDLTPERVTEWAVEKFVKCSKHIIDSYFTPNMFENLMPLPGAIKALKKLVDDGHDVVFITASPAGCQEAKQIWVKNHCPFIKEVMMTRQKYRVRGDVFIDDAPHNIKDYRWHNPKSHILTIAYPYNEEVAHMTDLRLGAYNRTEEAWGGFLEYINDVVDYRKVLSGYSAVWATD